MADPIIKINPSSTTDIEFEVKLEGLDSPSKAEVRLVISHGSGNYDCLIPCSLAEGRKEKWVAKVPKMPHVKSTTGTFVIEVIVDGYYFKPASGKIDFMAAPSVSIASKKAIKEDVEMVGQYSPNTKLLKPEFEPKQSSIKQGDQGEVIKRDDLVDRSRLDSIGDVTVPGDSDREPQKGSPRKIVPPPDVAPLNADEEESFTDEVNQTIRAQQHAMDDAEPMFTEEFNAKRVAEGIVRSVVGVPIKSVAKKGSLFERDRNGHAIIKGLETPEQREAKKKNADKVRGILSR